MLNKAFTYVKNDSYHGLWTVLMLLLRAAEVQVTYIKEKRGIF